MLTITENWTHRINGATYLVRGKTYRDVYAKLVRRAPRGHGTFESELELPSTSIKRLGTPNVQSLTLNLGYKITLPRWPGIRTQPSSVKAAWKKFRKDLFKHEYWGHRVIFLNHIKDFKKHLALLTFAKDAVIVNAATIRHKRIMKDQERFDRHTDHGRKRPGVYLPDPSVLGV